MSLRQPPFGADEAIFRDPTNPSLGNPTPPPATSLQSQTGSQPTTTASQSQVVGGQPTPGNIQSSSKLELILPAVYTTPGNEKGLVRISNELQRFLKDDMDVSRLNKIHQHLWFAGLERPARPLHTQVNLGREILVSEQTDLHLLWNGRRIFIKPLPDFLLCHEFWQSHICNDQDLFEKTSGFLLSYVWLVQRPCDFSIAQDKGLISPAIEWRNWTKFMDATVLGIDHSGKANINIRYRHGELRLVQVDWIYRFCSRTRSLNTLFRGYRFSYHNYGSFIERNLSWLTASTIYVAVVLTAMQVGLATDQLRDNGPFQDASFGFTVFAILAPLIVICTVGAVTVMVIIDNWNYTFKSKKTYNVNVMDDSKH